MADETTFKKLPLKRFPGTQQRETGLQLHLQRALY
jgi:hypothetical protein